MEKMGEDAFHITNVHGEDVREKMLDRFLFSKQKKTKQKQQQVQKKTNKHFKRSKNRQGTMCRSEGAGKASKCKWTKQTKKERNKLKKLTKSQLDKLTNLQLTN
ncbi:hypothetical protein [Roseibium sp.]|uniref:hypothetical protein n=1 Tax=Roseibium sp. TaxID=1936156 RepID=UPI003BA8F879